MIAPRELAVDALDTVRADDAYANLVMPHLLERHRLPPRDAALATDLTYGALRWRGFADAVIERCVTGGRARLDAPVLELLRVATYDLLIREAPGHVVNEWVDLAKKRVRRASGLVNATLRRVSESSREGWQSRLERELAGDARIAAIHSHPEWIVSAMRELLGEEIIEFLTADNRVPLPTFVALPGLAERPPQSSPTELSPHGFRRGIGNPALEPGVQSGTVRVQDEGSQIAALLLAAAEPIHPGEKWLDLCAGPGGKTALLAARAVLSGVSLVANEPHPHRANLVRSAVRPFSGAVTVTERDGRQWSARETYQRVLVDAPCSGVGALRRRPEARWRKSPTDLDELIPLQIALLESALSAVSIGGIVAYVTCSPLTAETVDVVDAVLHARHDIARVDTSEALARVCPTARGASRGTAVQLWPHRHNTDAMFIQLLRREG